MFTSFATNSPVLSNFMKPLLDMHICYILNEPMTFKATNLRVAHRNKQHHITNPFHYHDICTIDYCTKYTLIYNLDSSFVLIVKVSGTSFFQKRNPTRQWQLY